MRWYEYRMEADELKAPDELKAKLLAMQAQVSAASDATPAKTRKKPIHFPTRRFLGIAACFAVGFACCGVLGLTGAGDSLLMSMAGAGASASSTATYSLSRASMGDYSTENYALDTADGLGEENSSTLLTSEAAAGAETSTQEAKIIYTANLTIESKDYDAARETLDAALTQAGGYMEGSDEYTYTDGGARNLSLTLRVPEENYKSFLDAAAAAGNVTYKSEQAEDVTTQYMDVEARLDNLKAQRTRLQELQAKAETLADLLEIESSLSDVQYQIESWQSQLDWYDRQVSCCTVYVTLNEVQEYTPAAENFGERLVAAFSGGWKNFVANLQQLAVWLASAWPVVVIVAVVVVAVVIYRRKKRI